MGIITEINLEVNPATDSVSRSKTPEIVRDSPRATVASDISIVMDEMIFELFRAYRTNSNYCFIEISGYRLLLLPRSDLHCS